jgi:hypothetical protein
MPGRLRPILLGRVFLLWDDRTGPAVQSRGAFVLALGPQRAARSPEAEAYIKPAGALLSREPGLWPESCLVASGTRGARIGRAAMKSPSSVKPAGAFICRARSSRAARVVFFAKSESRPWSPAASAHCTAQRVRASALLLDSPQHPSSPIRSTYRRRAPSESQSARRMNRRALCCEQFSSVGL